MDHRGLIAFAANHWGTGIDALSLNLGAHRHAAVLFKARAATGLDTSARELRCARVLVANDVIALHGALILTLSGAIDDRTVVVVGSHPGLTVWPTLFAKT